MTKRLELTGRQFGRLTVLGMASWRYRRTTVWHCRCTCGRLTTVRGWSLTSGKTKSCGCLNRERVGEAAKARWAQYRAEYPRRLLVKYAYTHCLSLSQRRAWTRELARVAAHEGEPARENFRRRAWLNPHLRPALPAESKAVAA